NIQRKTTFGVESFGFGVNSIHPKADQHMINHLSFLNKFTDYYLDENNKLINSMEDFQVEIASLFGPCYFATASNFPLFTEAKKKLMKQLGLGSVELLTSRELDVIKYIASGYSAAYIATQLGISKRTVEKYTENIKYKLNCDSKISLINKAQMFI